MYHTQGASGLVLVLCLRAPWQCSGHHRQCWGFEPKLEVYKLSPLTPVIILPAELNLLVKLRVFWLRALLQLADVEEGKGVVDKAMQSPVVTVGVLVHEAGNKVRGDCDDKSLRDKITIT